MRACNLARTDKKWSAPRQKTWHAKMQTRTVNHLACTLRRETSRSQKTKARCRFDKRYGMLANNESMQPSMHRQEEMSAQTKDMACKKTMRACNLARTDKKRSAPRQKTWHASKQREHATYLARTDKKRSAPRQKTWHASKQGQSTT